MLHAQPCVCVMQDGYTPGTTPTIFSEASIDADVDIPFPFDALPQAALELPGNVAFNATLEIMLVCEKSGVEIYTGKQGISSNSHCNWATRAASR